MMRSKLHNFRKELDKERMLCPTVTSESCFSLEVMLKKYLLSQTLLTQTKPPRHIQRLRTLHAYQRCPVRSEKSQLDGFTCQSPQLSACQATRCLHQNNQHGLSANKAHHGHNLVFVWRGSPTRLVLLMILINLVLLLSSNNIKTLAWTRRSILQMCVI